MCLQKVGTVLHNHTVRHTRLDGLGLNSVPGISLTEAKYKGGRGGKEERRREKEEELVREGKDEAMSVRESEREIWDCCLLHCERYLSISIKLQWWRVASA